MHGSDFRKFLYSWNKENPRNFPWIGLKDPYKIWISEIMLQQTRTDQVIYYFTNFIEKFPSIDVLAKAPEDSVLSSWEGLGYYSRARNLHKTAQIIHSEYHGTFPNSYQDLIKLPGIGPYTASAICSFAFHLPLPAVDGNVIRVLSRIFGIQDLITTPSFSKKINTLLKDFIDVKKPALFNQVLMNFGATHCVPRNPRCLSCPFEKICWAYKHQEIYKLPNKTKAVTKKDRYFHYFFMLDSVQNTLIKKRNSNDIWKGLYDFPCVETELNKTINVLERNTYFQSLQFQSINYKILNTKQYTHKLTHQTLHITFYTLVVNPRLKNFSSGDFLLTNLKNLKNFAFPQIIRLFLNQIKPDRYAK